MSPSAFASYSLLGLALVVLLHGVRHGLDADHLSAIDGITRWNAARRPRLARMAGLWFSLGHGAVVFGVALTASALAESWRVPTWLDALGAWVSIAVLLGVAALNLAALRATRPHPHAHPVGWRCGLFARLLAAGSVPMVMAVGALFALSFDTLSQATLFAMATVHHGGALAAALLAGVFVVGMLVMDGLNGFWIAALIRRSDRTARVASRTMALTVAGIALLTAGLGVAIQTSDAAAAWASGKELWFGLAVIGVVGASFLAAMRLARPSFAGRPRRSRSRGRTASPPDVIRPSLSGPLNH